LTERAALVEVEAAEKWALHAGFPLQTELSFSVIQTWKIFRLCFGGGHAVESVMSHCYHSPVRISLLVPHLACPLFSGAMN